MKTKEQRLVAALESHRAGKFHEAEKLYRQILLHNPDDDIALHYYGVLCFSLGKVDESINHLEKSVQINPSLDALKDLAEIYLKQELKPEALECYHRAIQLYPNDSGLFYNIGMLFFNEKLYEDAIKSFNVAYELMPTNPEITYVLALTLHNINELENAEIFYKKTLELDPKNALAYYNLGLVAYYQGKTRESCELFEKAIQIDHHMPEVYNNLGNFYFDLGEPAKVIEASEKGLKLYPKDDRLGFNLSRAEFLQGNLENGWEYFRYRRLVNEIKRFGPYLLDYKGSLAGKTVLVYRDTGYGDSIQFLRYLPLLQEKGARVICSIQSELLNLASNSFPDIEFIPDISEGNTLNYDLQVNLTSLAYLFKKQFPFSQGYLVPDKDKVEEYKHSYFNNNNLKLGIVWQGSNVTANQILNSIEHVKAFLPFTKLPNVQVYSFMLHPVSDQLKELPDDANIIDLGSTFKDFSDSAAAMANLDLLVTADTAYAHLAGAIGKTAWVFLRYNPCWRWFQSRTDSPWYDSLSLFRQSQPNSWNPVLDNILLNLNHKLLK